MNKPTSLFSPVLRTFLEPLEQRIAPAGLANINYIDVTLGTPQLLHAGQGLKANGQYLIAVTQGQALIFTTDINGTNQFAPNDITGVAAGNGLKLTSFVNINGDIVTDLEPNGTLSDTSGNANGHNGLLLLDSTIDAITLRSVTPADVTPSDLALAQKTNPSATAASIYTNFLAPSTYSINGNIYAGGGVGDGVAGDGIVIDTAGTSLQASQFAGSQQYYSVTGIAPFIGTIKTGTAAGGNTFTFGYYTSGPENGQQYVGTPGTIPTLGAFTPGIGEAGGSINGLLVGNGASTGSNTPVAFTISAIDAGNGGIGAAGGTGGAGGSISNIQLDGDSGGLQILAGNGGAGPAGGNGGSITKLSDLGSVEGVVQIQTGSGGEGYLGSGGTAGALSLGQFLMNGDVHISLGSGGNALGNAGAGNTFSNATLAPTDSGGIATAVSVITSYRTAGDVGTPKLIDFNDDGYADMVFVTNSPDQIGIAFGGSDGINSDSPILYLSAPGIGAQTNNSPDVVVGDFTGQYYADGTPILDIAVANSTPNNTNGIEIFLNPATQTGLGDGYQGIIGSGGGWSELAQVPDTTADIGQNFITPTITVPLPVLTSQYDGQYLYSGAAVTNLVVGDFNGETYSTVHPNAPATNPILDLAYTTQVFADGVQPFTEAVMLQGTGYGNFFADFDYNTTVGAPTNMPVLLDQTGSIDAGAGHGAFQLAATAAIAGDTNSDMLVLTGADAGGNGDIRLIQDINPVQQQALNPIDSSFVITGSTLPTYTDALTTVDSAAPFYDTLYFNNPGGAYSNTVRSPATPIALAVTTTPGPGEGSDLTGSVFEVIALDAGNAISTVAGAYTPVPGSSAGLVSVSTNDTATEGVSLTGQPQTLLGTSPSYSFSSIVAGDLNGIIPSTGTPDIQFALYTSASLGSGNPTGLEVFDLPPGGTLHAASSYNGDLKVAGIVDAESPEYGYDASIVAFGLFTNASHTTTTSEVTGATTTTLTNTLTSQVGFVAALPTNTADQPTGLGTGSYESLIEGWGDGLGSSSSSGGGTVTENTVNVNLGLNNYNLVITAGNGGSSRLGSGGAGGNIGSASAAGADTLFITMPANYPDQPTVVLNPGVGGSGLISGGAGGALRYLNLSYAPDTNVLGGPSTFTAGAGGAGLFGSGGAGGSISNLQVQNGENFTAGNGGSGYAGGAGGIINGTAGVNGYSTQSGYIYLTGGTGGNGIVSGGTGGTITGFATEFLESVSGFGGNLSYIAGAGGSAIAGIGGAGGSILNSSPLSSDNNLSGPIILTAGVGGSGLIGGNGGSVTNFSNQSTNGTQVTAVSIWAGNGGSGVVGNGGIGGSISSIYASGLGVDTTNGYEYNSIIAGDGGASYGAIGGLGGSISSVTSVAQSSAEALAAGAGGDGLTKGGNGGVLLNDSASAAVNSTTTPKLIAIAGAGGNTYAALATAPGVANAGDTDNFIVNLRAFGNTNGIAGNGGSITNFKQQVGTQVAIDMIAGNGGSLENYGSQTATKTNVGAGGSIINTNLLGNAGDVSASAAIQNYNNGNITGFVQNTLAFTPQYVYNPTTQTDEFVTQTQLTDAVGNVGVVAGGAGTIKGGNPAGDSATKTGSVINFTAFSVMSMVAGSVDNIAAINTISGLDVYGTGNASAGSYKDTPVGHLSSSTVYYTADGAQVGTPEIGGALMDGAVVVLNNTGNLVGQRIFKLG